MLLCTALDAGRHGQPGGAAALLPPCCRPVAWPMRCPTPCLAVQQAPLKACCAYPSLRPGADEGDGQVILPSPEEIAANQATGLGAHDGNSSTPSGWWGGIVAPNALYDGVQVAVFDGVETAEECCRLTQEWRADNRTGHPNLFNWCPLNCTEDCRCEDGTAEGSARHLLLLFLDFAPIAEAACKRCVSPRHVLRSVPALPAQQTGHAEHAPMLSTPPPLLLPPPFLQLRLRRST